MAGIIFRFKLDLFTGIDEKFVRSFRPQLLRRNGRETITVSCDFALPAPPSGTKILRRPVSISENRARVGEKNFRESKI